MKIAILGYGIEGKTLVTYFKRRKANITVCDQNPKVKIPKKFEAYLGPNAFEKLKGFDLVFKSPGIPPDRLGKVKNLTTLTQYFFENCPCPIIGITGTKGKGTTSTLIYEILKAAGYDVHLGGNIGIPPLAFLPKLKKNSLVVLELSSFQTQNLTLSPHIAVILNTTSDHMDYHFSVKDYHAAKANLLAYQNKNDWVIANADYNATVDIAKASKGQLLTVSAKKNVSHGVQIQDGKIILKNPLGNGHTHIIMPISKVKLVGPHNLENVLPAVAVSSLLDVDPKTIKETVERFQGLPHRLEPIGVIKKVTYYNDSFSTTPETSIAAIRSFDQNLHLIVGGSEKYSDFTEWATICVESKNLKTLILTGQQSAHRMFDALRKANKSVSKKYRKDLIILRLRNLREAVIAAKTYAKSGDVVVLSPACASFEEFENYKERGETFKKLVSSHK